jgi:hypothetical protein
MSDGRRSSESWRISLLAALAFITWGLYVNWHHGWATRLQVALTQGFISLVSTYFSAELVIVFVRKFQKSSFSLIFGSLASYLVIYVLVLGGHFVAGTPEFWLTVIPGMITGVFFCYGYSLRIDRKLKGI